MGGNRSEEEGREEERNMGMEEMSMIGKGRKRRGEQNRRRV